MNNNKNKEIAPILNLKLSLETRQKVEAFSQVLHKTHTQILQEALTQYFEDQEEKLAQNKETNLSFDEFWDDLDI